MLKSTIRMLLFLIMFITFSPSLKYTHTVVNSYDEAIIYNTPYNNESIIEPYIFGKWGNENS